MTITLVGWSHVRKPSAPPPRPTEIRSAAGLTEALSRLVHEYAAARPLAPVAVVGSLSWVLGQEIGALVRDTDADIEQVFHLVVRSLRRAALGEVCRRSGTVH